MDWLNLIERLTNPERLLDTSNPGDVAARGMLAPLVAAAAVSRLTGGALQGASQFGAGATLPRALQHQREEAAGMRAPLFPLMPTADTTARFLADAGVPPNHLALPTQPAPSQPAVGVLQDLLGSLGDVARNAQQGGPQEAIRQAQTAYEAAPQQFEGQKFLGQALFDPTSYLGSGLAGSVARPLAGGAETASNPVVRQALYRLAQMANVADRADSVYGQGVETAFGGIRNVLGDAARATPIAGKWAELSDNARASRVGQSAQNVVGNLGVAMQRLEQGLGESLFPRDPLGNLSVVRGITEGTGEAGPLTMTGRKWEAPAAGAGPQEGARAPQYAAAPPVNAPAAQPEAAAQSVLDSLTPEAKQTWLNQALTGKSVPQNRTPEQEAWHRWQQMAEGDLRDADKAASYFGVTFEKGQPRDLKAVLDAATAQTGDDGAQALALAEQHAAEVGIQPPTYRNEGGRGFSTRGPSKPAKNIIETTGDVRAALKQLGADEDTIRTAEARFIYDRYGNTLPVNPSGVKGYNDQAVALRLQRETGGVPGEAAPTPPADLAAQPAPGIGDVPGAPASPLTAEAQQFLSDVEAGGIPQYVTGNLQRVARENGVTVTGATTPDEIIAGLRAKTAGAAEVPPVAPESAVAPSAGAIAPETTPPTNGVSGGLQDLALPTGLKGGAPRYGYGQRNFTLDFASDVDKALYIVAQDAKRSAKDADYLAFLQGVAPGMDEAALRQAGQQVRAQIKGLATGTPPGQDAIQVPRSFDALLGVRVQAPEAPVSGLGVGRQPVNDVLRTVRTAGDDPAALQQALDAAEQAGAPLPLVDELRVADRAYTIAKNESLDVAEIDAARERLKAAKQALQDAAVPEAPTVTTQPRPPVPDDIAARMQAPDQPIELGGDTSSLRAAVLDQARTVMGGQVDERLPQLQQAATKYLPALDQDRAAVQDISKSVGGAKDWTDLWDRVNAMPVDRPDLRKTLQQIRGRWGGADVLRASDDDILLHRAQRDYLSSLSPELAARFDANPKLWSDLTTIWRQQALAAPSYHVMNVMDALAKSMLTMGNSGFTEGARPFRPTEALDMLKQAWAKAGGAGDDFNPVLAQQFQDRGIAAPASILQGSNTTQIAAGRGLESQRAGGLGRLFRTNHEFGKGIEESARTAAFLQEYDKTLTGGATQAEAYQQGIDWANKLHFDYTATTNADEQLRKILGFHIFATRNLALYPEILAAKPAVAKALLAYDQEVKDDAQRGNYSKNKRIAASIPIGGQQVADLFFGRDGQIFFNPMRYLSIADQVLGDVRENEGITGVGKGLNTLSQIGLGPAPWVGIPLQALGVYGNQQPQNLLRVEPLLASGASLLTGKPEESFWRAGMRGVQERLAGEGLTFAEGKQSAPTPLSMPVNIRVIERVLESPEGQVWAAQHPTDPVPPAAKQAIAQGHGNALWDQAARELAAQSGQERTAGLLGLPIAFQAAGAAQIAADSAGIPDRNAGGGYRPLDPAVPLPGYQPGQPLITSRVRDRLLQDRARGGMPGGLAVQEAFRQAPDEGAPAESATSRLRDQTIQAWKDARAKGDLDTQMRLLADPIRKQYVIAYRLQTHDRVR